jgi:hypothetical protein
MYVPFDELADDARIWIYQANRSLSDSEEQEIITAIKKLFRAMDLPW